MPSHYHEPPNPKTTTPAGNPVKLPLGRLTASRLALAKKCPGSFALGHVETDSPPARTGTEVHAFIQRMLVDGEFDPAGVTDPDARAISEKLDPSEVLEVVRGYGADEETEDTVSGAAEILAEQGLALSPEANHAISLPDDGEARDYSAAPNGYLCGTADVIAVTGEAVVITDWKTGAMVSPPERNLQLRFLALAASLVYEVDTALVQICYINPDGTLHPTSAVLERGDLEGIAGEMEGLTAAVQKGRLGAPTFRLGDHCRQCPAFASCPAQAGAAQALIEMEAEELTPATAAEAWRRLVAVEAATKKVRKTLQDYLANRGEGIDLAAPDDPAGRAELKLIETRRETIVPEVAMPLLREIYGDEADMAVSVTKKGLQKLAGERARELLSDVEDGEGIKTTYSESLKEYGGR